MALNRVQLNDGKLRHKLAGGVSLLASCVALLVGCSDGAPNRATVFGAVTLDGQPLESGSIDFFPAEGTRGPTAGATIDGGRYRIESAKGVAVGKNRVEIHGMRKTGESAADPFGRGTQIDKFVESVPAKYHSESTLIREVVAGENEIDFEILSQP